MDALGLLIFIVSAGVVVWLVNNHIPMDNKIKKIFNIVAVIIIILIICNAFGVFSYLHISLPHLHR